MSADKVKGLITGVDWWVGHGANLLLSDARKGAIIQIEGIKRQHGKCYNISHAVFLYLLRAKTPQSIIGSQFADCACERIEMEIGRLALVGEQAWVKTENHTILRDIKLLLDQCLVVKAQRHPRSPRNAVGHAPLGESLGHSLIIDRQFATCHRRNLDIYRIA